MVSRDEPRFSVLSQGTPGPAPFGVLLRLLGEAETWFERRRQRRSLLELSDHMLKDIGVTRSEAFQEGRKPFWRG